MRRLTRHEFGSFSLAISISVITHSIKEGIGI